MTAFWFKTILTAVMVFGQLCVIADIGKIKKPTSPGLVAVSTLVQGLIIWGLWGLL